MKIPWRFGEPLSREAYEEVRRRAIFECCKWDPQVEDVATLCSFPLILSHETWSDLAAVSEKLAAETLAMEEELLQRPTLHKKLSLPRAIAKVLERKANDLPAAKNVRVMRFDFHFTTDGWRISEANADVPGGFIEAAGFTKLMAERYPGTTFENTALHLMKAMEQHLAEGSTVAFVHATAYTDDRQVMVFLARHCQSAGRKAVLCAPDHLQWINGEAWLKTDADAGKVDFIFRFFPAEWLPNLPKTCAWSHFFHGSRTPICNPATALLTQSKRLPLIWEEMKTPVPTWKQFLPPTFGAESRFCEAGSGWVFKPALGRVGELIGLAGVTEEKEWKTIRKLVRRHPEDWVVQQRFEAIPAESQGRKYFPCLGIYTVDGRAAGIYGRISPNALINHRAQDIAVLVENAPSSAPKNSSYERN